MEGARTGLVGRDDELRRLGIAIMSGRPAAVVGEAGIGKTSLVRSAASVQEVTIHEGGGFATLVAMPFLALRRAVGDDLEGDAAHVAEAVEERIGPDLLFIDDLQWVDDGSLRVLELLAGRLLLVTAIRAGDGRAGLALATAERIGSEAIKLGGVDEETARSIVRRVRPSLAAATVEQVVARAGGNPLVLEEMAAYGAPSPVLARALETGYDLLSPDGRDVVELLAIADRPIDRDRLGPAIDEPIRAGLIVERRDLIELRHALLAEAIRARLNETSRAALHERVAGLVDDPAEKARHQAAAGDGPGARGTALAALPSVTDPLKRATLFVIVAEASPAGDLEPRLRAARALADLSMWDEVVALIGRAFDGAAAELLAGQAALLAHATYSLGRHDEARRHLDEGRSLAIDPAGPPAARLAIEDAAFMVNVDGRILDAIALLDLELARRPAETPEAFAMRAIREAIALLAVMDADIGFLRAAIDAGLNAGSFASAADLARVVNLALLLWTGAEAALDFLDGTGRRFEAAGVSGVALEFQAERVQAALLAGRLADAVAFGDELLERPAPWRARQAADIFRARALGLMGRIDEAQASLAALEGRVTEDFVGRGELLAAGAEIALWGGMPERAIELATAVRAVPAPIMNAYLLSDLTCAWAALELGTAPAPLGDIAPIRIDAGAIPESAALSLLHEGRPDDAAAQFSEAAALWSGFHEPRAMLCRWAHGEALRQAGRHDEMAERLTSVLDEATAGGHWIIALRARRSLRQAGLRTTADQRPSAPAGLRLTPRESELIELVGRGLTNIEIARRMGLGRPTVARILSNAMAKLGAASRAQAVVLAAELE